MPEGIIAHVVRESVEAVKRDFALMDKAADRASMWTVREVARRFNRNAARSAPVYKGPPRRVTVDGQLVELVPRELKKSFHSSRRLRRTAEGWSVVTGPRGPHVKYYAARQNARTGFIDRAYDEAMAEAHAVHEKALEKALARLRR